MGLVSRAQIPDTQTVTRAEEIYEEASARVDGAPNPVSLLVAILAEAIANAEQEIQRLRTELTGRETLVRLIK